MWADRDDARRHWADAVKLPDDVLDELLSAAWPACVEFAPALDPDAASIPWQYVLAHVLQAKEVRRAGVAESGDVIGVGDYAIRARPLSSTVKQLLRPERGRPGIG